MSLIKVQVLSKKVTFTDAKGKQKTFRRYFTYANIVVKGEEEKGAQRKGLNVAFTNNTMPKDFVRGIFVIDTNKDQISMPFNYEVTKDEDGNDVFPTVWIRGYESWKVIQPKIENTCNFIVDEEETKETEIESND